MRDTQNTFFPAEVNHRHEIIMLLLQRADAHLDIAKGLRAKGKLQKSLALAFIAAKYIDAARSLERLEQVTLQ